MFLSIYFVVTKISSSKCPQDTIGVIASESGVATINVSVVQRFKFTVGSYDCELFSKSSNCSVNVYIKKVSCNTGLSKYAMNNY